MMGIRDGRAVECCCSRCSGFCDPTIGSSLYVWIPSTRISDADCPLASNCASPDSPDIKYLSAGELTISKFPNVRNPTAFRILSCATGGTATVTIDGTTTLFSSVNVFYASGGPLLLGGIISSGGSSVAYIIFPDDSPHTVTVDGTNLTGSGGCTGTAAISVSSVDISKKASQPFTDLCLNAIWYGTGNVGFGDRAYGVYGCGLNDFSGSTPTWDATVEVLCDGADPDNNPSTTLAGGSGIVSATGSLDDCCPNNCVYATNPFCLLQRTTFADGAVLTGFGTVPTSLTLTLSQAGGISGTGTLVLDPGYVADVVVSGYCYQWFGWFRGTCGGEIFCIEAVLHWEGGTTWSLEVNGSYVILSGTIASFPASGTMSPGFDQCPGIFADIDWDLE